MSGPGPVVKLSVPVEGGPRELDDNDESGDDKIPNVSDYNSPSDELDSQNGEKIDVSRARVNEIQITENEIQNEEKTRKVGENTRKLENVESMVHDLLKIEEPKRKLSVFISKEEKLNTSSDPSEIQGEQNEVLMVVPSKMYAAIYDLKMVQTDTKVLAPWYELNEAAKISYNQFVKVMKDCGMEENPWLPKTFFKWKNDNEFIIMGQQLDDAIFKGTSLEIIDETLDQIDKKLKLIRNYGPKKILGCAVKR